MVSAAQASFEGDNMRRSLATLLVLVGVATLGGSGAAADDEPLADVVAFSGTALYAKERDGYCSATDQSGFPTGPGLGTPLSHAKAGYWKLELPGWGGPERFVEGAAGGSGTMLLCGLVGPSGSLKDMAIGAACWANSGYDGFGRLRFAGRPGVAGPRDLGVRNLGWAPSAGQLQIWHARVGPWAAGPEGWNGHLAGMVSSEGFMWCVTKTGQGPNKSGGATYFLLTGVLALGG